MSHDKGKTFKTVIETLKSLDYTVYYKVLNSKHFKLPQNRERIYIVAFRDKIDFKFPEGNQSNTYIKSILESNVSNKYFISKIYLNTLREHRKRHENKGNGFGYQIISPNQVSNTIMVGGMGKERNLVIDKTNPNIEKEKDINTEGIRNMTPREWARLQGFPDTYRFPVSDTQQYKQLGNSVSINVIEAIAREIYKSIKKSKS